MFNIKTKTYNVYANTISLVDFYNRCVNNGVIPLFVSNFKNPYQNFALEQLIFTHNNGVFPENKSILIYRNQPSIIFGAFQNPWMECNIKHAYNNNVWLCRRKSGGGTVFHDMGNLNITVLSLKKDLNRTKIMKSISIFLSEYFKKDITTNKRNDIILDKKFKISGSAAKFEKDYAYHHFTLLCHSDLSMLNNILQSNLPKYSSKIFSTSTKSVPSTVCNLYESYDLFENDLHIFIIKFAEFLTLEYSRPIVIAHVVPFLSDELIAYVEEFKSYNWIYGNTPSFDFDINLPPKFDDSNQTIPLNLLITAKQKYPFTMKSLLQLIDYQKHFNLLDVLNHITF